MVQEWHPPHGAIGAALWVTSLIKAVSVPRVWDTLWDVGGTASWDCTRFSMGCLEEEPRVEKRRTEMVWGGTSKENRWVRG